MQTENFSLKNFNTFHLEAHARHYFSCDSKLELTSFVKKGIDRTLPYFILGGGSNLLFTQDYNGTIIHPLFEGIEVIKEDGNDVYVKVGAGVVWDDFVAWAVEHDLYGVENLSHIPGNVGASPVQNIGAYGVEAKDVVFAVNTIDARFGDMNNFTTRDCKFGYRNSVFKHEQAGKQIVCEVIFKLQKKAEFNIAYGSIQEELAKESDITLQSIRDVIIRIRESKLPDPEKIGNAGSFFKNPVISKDYFSKIHAKFPDVVSYPAGDEIKVAAGWLLDKLGFKGYSIGGAKVHDKQALVLTNTGTATGNEIVELSKTIQAKVFDTTGIELEPEVIFL